MDVFADITAARSGILDFLMTHGAELPDDVRAKAVDLNGTPSAVDQICGFAELLYARQADVGTPGRKLAAQLALYASGGNQWQNMRGGRGEAIAWAMMRRNGYEAPAGVTYQAAADDPEPDARFVPAPVEPGA
jgi:hypothetical protein